LQQRSVEDLLCTFQEFVDLGWAFDLDDSQIGDHGVSSRLVFELVLFFFLVLGVSRSQEIAKLFVVESSKKKKSFIFVTPNLSLQVPRQIGRFVPRHEEACLEFSDLEDRDQSPP
jgi:hypothetical protein